MSDALDNLLKVGVNGSSAEARKGRRAKHPAGWFPGVLISGDGGSVITEPREVAPDNWSQILEELLPPGVDVSLFEVDGENVEVRAWDSGDGEGGTRRMYYFKAKVRRRSAEVAKVNLDEIIEVAKKATVAKVKKSKVDRAYWLQVTDLQAGQADGTGVEGMVSKALQLGGIALKDLAMLEAAGTPANSVFVPITGDLVEGVSGWYDMQAFSVQLDRRDQVKLVRRLLTEFLVKVASAGLPVHVAVVPGNHGENRMNGKAFTSLGDNDDVAIVEQIAEAFSIADNLKNVTFSFPGKERLSLTVEVLGWVVGLTHGHIARGGTGVEGKILNWFKSMSASRDPIGDSDILFSGHYHHARYQQLIGDTSWVQGGALCDQSAFFSQTAGLVSDPVVMKGTITREQKLEIVMPHSWPRTQVKSFEVA